MPGSVLGTEDTAVNKTEKHFTELDSSTKHFKVQINTDCAILSYFFL